MPLKTTSLTFPERVQTSDNNWMDCEFHTALGGLLAPQHQPQTLGSTAVPAGHQPPQFLLQLHEPIGSSSV